MPLWLKRSLFLIVAGVAAWIAGYYLAPYGFGHGRGSAGNRLDADVLEGLTVSHGQFTRTRTRGLEIDGLERVRPLHANTKGLPWTA